MTALPARPVSITGELTDAAVVEQSWTDADAFAVIFDRHAVTVHRFLSRRVGAQLADDLTGQTMLVAFDQRRRFDLSQHNALPWLYGIAANLLRRHTRTEERRHRALAKSAADTILESHAESVTDRVTAAAQPLGKALAKLPAAEREIVLLVAWESLSYEEIAVALDIPIGTVCSRLHRARTKLRRALERRPADMDDLELLARLRPQVDDPDPAVLAKHRRTMLNGASKPVRRRWSMPLAIGAAAAAGIVAVGLVVGLPNEVPDASPSSTPPAVTLLANAADAAAKTPAGQGNWAYTSTVTVFNDAGLRTNRTQTWEKVDGTDALIRTNRDGKFDETRTGDNSDIFTPSLRHPTYRFLATLPTDPTALRDAIYAHARQEVGNSKQYTVDQWAFQMIGNLVQSAAPPALKAALYRVAATVPGVESVDNVTDAAGRQGIGVAHTVNNAGDRTILIFDRTTYQVMGRAGQVSDGRTDSVAVLATGLVAEAGQTP
ncbi:CU044_5270 family protein [Kibdelosporangium philippinense]|uniref:CU044_5270 family protein n=1 Tax=Kibdelosporangium philippinense TaxID=211113 RepID=A0ABS8ZSV0_9PSEU|nr:CU044_5270 family protein [Kibdelosporangium philippinense]MCE7010804.1 CU044_5270 family protein [Kibdelosporangium philippinense]